MKCLKKVLHSCPSTPGNIPANPAAGGETKTGCS